MQSIMKSLLLIILRVFTENMKLIQESKAQIPELLLVPLA
jgi:hypothetical protein